MNLTHVFIENSHNLNLGGVTIPSHIVNFMTNNGGYIKVANFFKIPNSSFWNSQIMNLVILQGYNSFIWSSIEKFQITQL